MHCLCTYILLVKQCSLHALLAFYMYIMIISFQAKLRSLKNSKGKSSETVGKSKLKSY